MISLFPSGPTALGQQLGTISSLLAPPKATPAMLGATPLGMDAATALAPQKIFNFTPDTGLGTTFGSMGPPKPSPADLFLPGPQNTTTPAPATTPVAGTGPLGSLGGVFTALDPFNASFQAAGTKYGIDPAWLKGIAAEEQGWGAGATSGAGAQGLMQIMPGGYPALEALYPNWQHDANQNIMLGAAILNAKRQENGGDLSKGTKAYLGSGVDPWTGISTDQYLTSVSNYAKQIGMGSGGTSGGGGLASAFGQYGTSVPDWGEFNVPSDNGLYGYGTSYGLNGTNHTGLDIPMPYHTAYTAPMSGTVVCAGTNVGSGVNGEGCAAFSDTIGGGAGRVELLLDSGAVLIFGHSSASAFQPGQHVTAGQVLGWSGGENSAHVHLEARVRDSSTPSGWRIVDPRTVLGGATGMGSGITGQQGSIASQIMQFLRGR